MNSILAWFITFNFVNISWVFFRAKEWDDALKVLKGMAGFSGVLNEYAFKQYMLNGSLGSKNIFSTINGDSYTIKYLIVASIIVFFLKNSNEYINNMKFNLPNLLFYALITLTAILYLNNMGEFLYFNF
ncbi:MAG: MBOAT family protein, partial [Campylobacterota bacterium]|nr:MBOAT family protein [Campylobacterota bacterium]